MSSSANNSGSVVVITGSTRGIGLGLADAFLARGCRVVVSGRETSGAVQKLSAKHGGGERIEGKACDVTRRSDVEALWDAAVKRFGRVDIWINNAGAGTVQVPFVEQTGPSVESVCATNLTGVVIGTQVALQRMKAQQPSGGRVFNVEGFGADGRLKRTGMAVYGATKCGVRYFTNSVADELEQAGGGAVSIGIIQPGVVVTDMLVDQFNGAPRAAWEKQRKLYSIIGDPVDVTAPWLADKVLAGTKNGDYIGRLSLGVVLMRLLSPSMRKRDLFAAIPPPKTVG